jgi:hypothetical protein
MASRKLKEGNLARIDLSDNTTVFARVLSHSQAAFYAARFPSESTIDLSNIYKSEVLFKIAVMNYAFNKNWKIVDHQPLEANLKEPNEYFIKDVIDGSFSIYRSSDGSFRPSSYEQCKNLECAAVWDPHHVESRLVDYFAGRPNIWLESVRAKP